MSTRLDGRGFTHPAHVRDGPGPCSGNFLPWNGDVEGGAASCPVRRDSGEGEGLGGRVIRTCDTLAGPGWQVSVVLFLNLSCTLVVHESQLTKLC